MKKKVLTSVQGYLLVSDGTKEDAEIFGGGSSIRLFKCKNEFTYYHLDNAPIEKGIYLVTESKLGDKDPLYEVSIKYLNIVKDVLFRLYKLR